MSKRIGWDKDIDLEVRSGTFRDYNLVAFVTGDNFMDKINLFRVKGERHAAGKDKPAKEKFTGANLLTGENFNFSSMTEGMEFAENWVSAFADTLSTLKPLKK